MRPRRQENTRHLAGGSDALGTGSAAYAALGVGTIREAMTTLDELLAYQGAADRDSLPVRVRLMLRVGSELTEEAAIVLIDELGAPPSRPGRRRDKCSA